MVSLYHSQGREWKGPKQLSHTPFSVMEDAPQPDMDFSFSLSKCERQQPTCWQESWIWTSWQRAKLVSAQYASM